MIYYYSLKRLVKKAFIYSLTFIDLINFCTVNNLRLYNFCLIELKCLLFEIKGHCISSAFCCNNIQIKYKGNWLRSLTQFENVIKKDSVMTRFQPNLTQYNKINSFSCNSLSEKKLCNDYESRPKFCRVYPFSVLFSKDTIKSGCGFFLVEKDRLPSFSSKKIKQEFYVLKYNHNLL
jgi:Fe-S-cluster containining protein